MYLLGLHLLEDGVPRCAYFSRLFQALRRGQTFPQVCQSFVFGGLGGLDGAAFFLPGPRGPFRPISSSEVVTGSACSEGRLAALRRGL